MWELDHKEGWAPKNWCFWTVVLEKTLDSPLDCKEIKPVNPKGNQPWIFIDAEAETPILWPPDTKSRFSGKASDAEKDWRETEKVPAEDEMVGWHNQLNAHEFEQTPGDSEGRESLVCCSPWGRKESDMTEQLNNNNSTKCYFILFFLVYRLERVQGKGVIIIRALKNKVHDKTSRCTVTKEFCFVVFFLRDCVLSFFFSIYFCGCTGPQLRHVGFLVVPCKP